MKTSGESRYGGRVTPPRHVRRRDYMREYMREYRKRPHVQEYYQEYERTRNATLDRQLSKLISKNNRLNEADQRRLDAITEAQA